jgi:hypothetical protein
MIYVPMNKFMIRVRGLISLLREGFSRLSIYQQTMLFALIILLRLASSIATSAEVYASGADPGPGKVCTWYTVLSGNTLGGISLYYHTSIWSIAHANHIFNINHISVAQRLCIPTTASGQTAKSASGLLSKGGTSYLLERSSSQQVPTLLKQAATRHGLPEALLLAIAWQESGWNQQVIAHDGGIGIMQIMPSTAQGLNTQVNGHYDPYKLNDNIELGAIYLHSLWQGFQGNEAKVISAYNQGGSSVSNHGICNWPYVHNVQALMKQYN